MIDFSDEELKDHGVSSFELKRARFVQRVGYLLVFFFYRILNKSRAIGVDNIPKGGGVMIAANHISGVDTLLVPFFALNRITPFPVLPPAKEELFKVPVVGFIVKILGAFPVKRRARDFNAMRKIAYLVKNAYVLIFPEGTRSKTGELLKGRAGVGWIAYNTRPAVIPTLVINSDKYFWPGKKGPWFRVPYTVVYGEPLDLVHLYENEDSKQNSQAIADAIMDAIAKLKEKHKDLYIS